MKYFIDFEATQFSNEIISIGCVRENGDEFYSLVKPKKNLTPFIVELTGITNEMLVNAPSTEEVFSQFFNWCAEYEDDLPVFYCYGNADVNFVKKNFNNSKNFKAKSILGYLYSGLRDYAPTVQKHFGLIQSVSLIKVVNYYNETEISQCHDALEDALMLKFVYEQIQIHTQDEDQNAFPEYKQQSNSKESIKRKVFLIKKDKIIKTFGSVSEAVNWVYNRLPNNDNKQVTNKDNLAKKIKRASNTGNTYIDYNWKIEKVK